MTRRTSIVAAFVESAPDQLDDGVIYVSLRFNTAIHKCLCSCGLEVVTPLSSAAWQLTRRGDAISLYPSIGNWSFRCQSHYWIKNNRVIWAEKWSRTKIERSRARDIRDLAAHFAPVVATDTNVAATSAAPDQRRLTRWWSRFVNWWSQLDK